MAFERVHGPIGPMRLDYLAALICQTITNVNRDPKQDALTIDRFLPDWDAPQEVDLGDDP